MSRINVKDDYVSSSNILCLDIDCLEELFEWLSLRDLRALRASCKRMRQAVDYYIKTTYPNRFGTLQICDTDVDNLKSFNISSFCKLFKHIEFSYCPWSEDLVNGLVGILEHIEKITITSVATEGNLYGRFLGLCKNLKYLHIYAYSTDWIQRKYPTIEHLAVIDPQTDDLNELQTFLESNPNIRRFSFQSSILVDNADWMLESNIKLDQLDIEVNIRLENLFVMDFYDVLKTLYTKGFYKKLHIYTLANCEQTVLDRMATLPGLEKLYFENVLPDIVWPSLQIKEITMDSASDVHNIEELMEKCANIERVYFQFASFEQILPFIHRSTKLKKLKIQSPRNDTYLNDGVIDLAALNRERAQCTNGSKLTIYVKERVYLDTKRALMQTDLALVELKRAESYDWPFYFYSFCD